MNRNMRYIVEMLMLASVAVVAGAAPKDKVKPKTVAAKEPPSIWIDFSIDGKPATAAVAVYYLDAKPQKTGAAIPLKQMQKTYIRVDVDVDNAPKKYRYLFPVDADWSGVRRIPLAFSRIKKSNWLTYATINGKMTILKYDARGHLASLPPDLNMIPAKSLVIPSSLDGKPVRVIGPGAFNNNNVLELVTIPNTVTTIGLNAFACVSLRSITIPDSVTSIGGSAFSCCDSLSAITIPDSVTSIGERVFDGCEALKTITVSPGNRHFVFRKGALFSKDGKRLIHYAHQETGKSYAIPPGVTTIDGGAFSECSSLSSITIPNSVTSIGDSAFWECTSLESITIPDSVTTIDYNTFGRCKSLTSITIPESVTRIDGSAFKGCTSLKSITIPESVTSIGGRAFAGCTKLDTVKFPKSTKLGKHAFRGCPWQPPVKKKTTEK